MSDFNLDKPNEKENVTYYPYKDNRARIQRYDPYGFYKISLERGETPSALKEQLFTSVEYAIKGIDLYLSSKEPTYSKRV